MSGLPEFLLNNFLLADGLVHLVIGAINKHDLPLQLPIPEFSTRQGGGLYWIFEFTHD
jgi:hypothetical protein